MLKGKTIEVTTDYDQFSQLDGNRPYNQGLLNSLEESILNDADYLADRPINVNEDMVIVDGKHRHAIAKKLEKPLYYIVSKGTGLKEAQIWNSRVRQWLAQDYLHALLTQKDPNAQILSDFMDEYKLSIAICVKLLSRNMGSRAMRLFREGKFEVKDVVWAQNAAGILLTIREYSPDYAFAQTACIYAVQRMMEKLPDPKIFERQLKKYQTTVTRRASTKEFLNEFQLILDMGGESKYRLS